MRFEPEELKALEQASSSALVIDSFVPEGAIDPVYFEDTYYLGAGKNGERGYRVLTEALAEDAPDRRRHVHLARQDDPDRDPPCTRTASSSSGSTSPTRSTTRAEIDRGAEPKIRDQERTLAERLISELSGTEFHAGELRGRVPKAPPEGDRAEDRRSGDRARRGRGPACDDRPGRDTQGEPRTEGAGEGGSYQGRSEDHVREAASPPAPRVVSVQSVFYFPSALLLRLSATAYPVVFTPTILAAPFPCRIPPQPVAAEPSRHASSSGPVAHVPTR